MSKSIFKKTAAIVCGAATLVTIGMTAMMANAREQVDPTTREDIDPNKTTICADQVYAEPGEKVRYEINIINNAGYSGSGFSLEYDSRLTPDIKSGTTDKPVATQGAASEGLLVTKSLNLKVNIFAAASAGSDEVCENDGVYVWTSFTVPEDAKPGDTFPMKLTCDRFFDTQRTPIENVVLDGWIKIKGGDTTTTTTTTTTTQTTTTTTETTTTTTLTTTSTTESTTTTTETAPGKDTTSTTTVTTTDDGTGTTTTTTLGDDTTTTTSTTANGGNNNAGTTAAPGAKTGDAGVGAAVAGLMLAAAAAVAVAAKKKED